MPAAAVLPVAPGQLRELEGWLRAPSLPAGLVRRARIVLLAAQGMPNTEIAELVGVSRPTVICWRRRFAAQGIDGLRDGTRPGRPRRIDGHQRLGIVAATLVRPPERLGLSHWSSRLLARELGVSNFTVARVWREHNLKPWQQETFKFSTDPELEAKLHDVVGLYLHPPQGAVVLCVDEKSQIQALERTQPPLPVRPGSPSGRPTTMSGTARRRCSRRWRSPPGRCSTSASHAIAIKSSWRSSPRSPGRIHAGTCMWCWTTTARTSTPRFGRGWSGTRASGCTSRPQGRVG